MDLTKLEALIDADYQFKEDQWDAFVEMASMVPEVVADVRQLRRLEARIRTLFAELTDEWVIEYDADKDESLCGFSQSKVALNIRDRIAKALDVEGDGER